MPMLKAILEDVAGYKEYNPDTRCLTRPTKSRRRSANWKVEQRDDFAIGAIPITDFKGKRWVHSTPQPHPQDQEDEDKDEVDLPPPNVPGQGDGNANHKTMDQHNNPGQREARSRHGGSQHGDPRHGDPHHEGSRHAGSQHGDPHHESSRDEVSRHQGSRHQDSHHEVYNPAQQNIPAPYYRLAQRDVPAPKHPLAAPRASASSHSAALRSRSTAHRAPTLREPTNVEHESLKVHTGIDPHRRDPAGYRNIKYVQDWELASSCYSHNKAPSQAPSRMSTPPLTTVPNDSISMRGFRGRSQIPPREPAPNAHSVTQDHRYEGPSSARHGRRPRSEYSRAPESAYEGRSLTGHRSTSRSRHPLVPESVLHPRYTGRDIPSSYGGSPADQASRYSESQASRARHRSPYHSESGYSRRTSDSRHAGSEAPWIEIYTPPASSHHGPSSRVETLSSSRTSVQGLAHKADQFTHHGHKRQ
jgi:hypothetical protein